MTQSMKWLPTNRCIPPHGVARPEQVSSLIFEFRRSGWDVSKPSLIGYVLPGTEMVQLLSGSHRWAAANEIGFRVPVVVIPYQRVVESWGNLDLWEQVMKVGNR